MRRKAENPMQEINYKDTTSFEHTITEEHEKTGDLEITDTNIESYLTPQKSSPKVRNIETPKQC